ncbi:efflux RND transporter periplasmic adaptor subunit [Candidatus Beckwithbacteria bacterium]|nr:efflux RND transporter periplasmic adaptor subunit [Candidatus Beckwithbacteria bacterium]
MILNPFKWSLKIKILSFVVLIILGGGGYYFYHNNQAKKTATKISTQVVTKGNLVSSISLSGQIEQSNLISVSTKASGEVKQVYVTDGQIVKAGDKIAEITLDTTGINNQSSAWASYLNAKKNVDSAVASQYTQQATMLQNWDTYMDKTKEDNYEDPNSEYRNLADFKIIQDQWLASEINYKTQETSINSAQASLSQAWYNYQLYQATITAPVDGTIVGLNLVEGLSLVGSENSSGGAVGQTVASIKTVGNPIASFTATEVDILNIKSGQKVNLTMDNISDKTYTGTVAGVDRVGTVTSGVTQYTILVKFNEASDNILTNMSLTGDIVLAEKNDVLIIPTTAITEMNGKKIVKVIKNGQTQPIEITTGLETDTEIEVLTGLTEGDVIINGTTATNSINSSNNEKKGGTGFMMGGMGGGQPPSGGGAVRGVMMERHD